MSSSVVKLRTYAPPSADAILGRVSTLNRKLSSILMTAYEENASDIHFNPERTNEGNFQIVVRFRVHTEYRLVEKLDYSRDDFYGFYSLLKKVAAGNIATNSICQDLSFEYSKINCRYRVAVSPTSKGEYVVFRIIRNKDIPTFDQLNFQSNFEHDYRSAICQKQGLILVTGPTGSGKSTTLQSGVVELLKLSAKNVISIEDPVEREIPGVKHLPITSQVGWISAIKSVLRQDPDVVYIGEIRDSESAHKAIEAANTGHLVLSTLHTNGVKSTVKRLLDLGVERDLLSTACLLITGQRILPREDKKGAIVAMEWATKKGLRDLASIELVQSFSSSFSSLLERGIISQKTLDSYADSIDLN